MCTPRGKRQEKKGGVTRSTMQTRGQRRWRRIIEARLGAVPAVSLLVAAATATAATATAAAAAAPLIHAMIERGRWTLRHIILAKLNLNYSSSLLLPLPSTELLYSPGWK
jgi:hypothetical protein